MFRRVATRCFGAIGQAQTLSRGSFQSVLHDAKLTPLAPCSIHAQHSRGCQVRYLTNTRFNAAETTETTTTPKKRGRPRKDATEKTTTTRTARKAAKAPSAKTTKAKKKAVPKKKKKAAAKKKPAAKKPRVKKLTAVQAFTAKVSTLRREALLDIPKLLPISSYAAFVVEQAVPGTSAVKQTGTITANYKELSTSELEHLSNIARQNRIANAKTMEEWVEKHTPDEIRIANSARRQLNKLSKSPLPEGSKTRISKRTHHLIKDPRHVKQADTPFIAFSRERWASGDLLGTNVTEAAKALGSEWKGMSEGEKQKYIDAYESNREQYHKDYNAIFTKGKRSPPKSPIQPIAE